MKTPAFSPVPAASFMERITEEGLTKLLVSGDLPREQTNAERVADGWLALSIYDLKQFTGKEDILLRAAGRPDLSPEAGIWLAEQPLYIKAVAANWNAPTEALDYASLSLDPLVRLEVARNPNTSASALIQLSDDADELVRDTVAARPDLEDRGLSGILLRKS